MFIRTKKYKNNDGTEREYLHLVENKKVDGKVIQHNLYNFGRKGNVATHSLIDKIVESLLPFSSKYSLLNVEQDLDAKSSLELGPVTVFDRLWRETGLKSIIDKSFSNNRFLFNGEMCIFNMVLNRLSAPCSKRMLKYFQDDVYGPALI